MNRISNRIKEVSYEERFQKKRNLLKSADNYKKKRKGQTRREQAAAAERKREFLASSEGQAALERIRLADELSQILQIKSMTK